MKYTKKPITVEAIQFNMFNREEISEFVGQDLKIELEGETAYVAGMGAPIFSLIIPTLEGAMKAMPGDFIIKGEFYPCKPDIFEASYNAAIPVHSEDECNSTENNHFFNFKAIYHGGVGDTLQSILDAIENNKPHSFMELWQAANRSSYIAIFNGLPISADDGMKEIRFAVHIESHGDFKEVIIHHTDFVDFCNQIVFNQPKRTWMDLGYSIDENYYVPIYSDWVYKSEEYNIKVV